MLFNFSSLPDGLWFFNVTALNSSSWSNSTSTRNVTIDTIYPTITNGTRTESDASILNRNNIYINMSSSDTNLANITIYLYNSSRSLINSSNGTGASVAVNFTDLSDVDGLYYFNATACDRAGNCNSSFTTRSVILNASSPAVTAVSASSITSSGASISVTSNKSANITLSYGTTVSLGTNSSTNTFATSGSFSLSGLSASTTYYYNITICDRAGNCITNGTNSFTTSAASNETTTTTSGSGTAATVPVTVNLDAGYTKAMVVAETLNFKVGTESHSVFVQSLVGNILTLKIRSDPQIATFNVGDAKKFELNNDSYYDLYIKFNSIKSGAANLTIQTIHEAISTANAGLPTPPETVSPPAESPTDDDTRESEVSKVWIYVIIAVIILVAIVWYFVARKK
jgi:uncharacterized Fe-S cluster protein YjdI